MANENEVKPGWKTTEFWLSVAAAVVGFVMASGAFGDESSVMKALGLVASGLAVAGYSVARGITKK